MILRRLLGFLPILLFSIVPATAQTELYWSIVDNDPVSFLRSASDSDLTQPSNQLRNLAVLAVQRGNSDVLNLLLQKGADPNAQDSSGTPLLFLAAKDGRIDETEVLLKRGADPTTVTSRGNTLLMAAAQSESPNLVRMVLKFHPDTDQANDLGDTPLLVACRMGNLENIKLLIANGADLERTDYLGRTALSLARMTGSSNVTAFLEAYFSSRPASPPTTQLQTTRPAR